MARHNAMVHTACYYGFLVVCLLSFLAICCGFLLYRLLLKPLIFGLVLLLSLPLMISAFRSVPYTDSPAK